MSIKKNTLLNNRYILIKHVGSGSFSNVWLVFDINDEVYYALKIQHCSDYKDAKYELLAHDHIKKLTSKNILNIFDSFEYEDDSDDEDDNPHVCMAMECMSCSSHDLIKLHKTGLPIEIVMKIIKDVLIGLSQLHEANIVHRDIKPENILINTTEDKHKNLKEKLNCENIVKKHSAINKKKNITKNISNIVSEISKNNNKYKSNDNSSDNSDSDSDSDSNTHNSDNLNLNNIFTNNTKPKIKQNKTQLTSNINTISKNSIIVSKLSDMGHCILPIDEQCIHPNQANYYLAPEIILGLECDNSVDMWAIGCTIYELLTGKILFDSEKYNGNTYRHHLYMIVEKLGMFPKEWINNTPMADIFFNKKKTCIKGYRGIKFQRPLWKDLFEISQLNSLSPQVEADFLDFMMKIFKYNSNTRLTSNNALKHNIFKHF